MHFLLFWHIQYYKSNTKPSKEKIGIMPRYLINNNIVILGYSIKSKSQITI